MTPRTDEGQRTRQLLTDAAIESLRDDGFAGSSARSIARRAGVNQALIFYHFGSVHALLLAALDETSRRRMEIYRTAASEAEDLPALTEVAGRVFRDDLASGHIKILAELIAGASANPDLGPQIVARVEPWISFAQEQVERSLAGSPIEPLVPARDTAYALVAFFLGIELLTHLDGDRAAADRLFALASAAATMASGVLPGAEGTIDDDDAAR